MPQTNLPVNAAAAMAYEQHMVPGMSPRWAKRVVSLAVNRRYCVRTIYMGRLMGAPRHPTKVSTRRSAPH